MPARFASGREVDDDVALAVEATGVAHIRVVVGRCVDVVVFGPADALEVNRHRRAGRPRGWCHADDARFDGEERTREQVITPSQRDAVPAADVLGNRHGPLDPSVASGRDLRDHVVSRSKAGLGDAAPDRRFPHEPQWRGRLEAFAAQDRAGADRSLRRSERQRRACELKLGLRDRLGLIRFGVRRSRGSPWCRAEPELRPRQTCDRRLLVIQITLPLPARVQLGDVIADRTGRTKPRDRRSARARGRHPPDFVIVPVDHPGAFHGAPAEPSDRQLDQRSNRSRCWRQLERRRHADTVLSDWFAVDEGDDVVHPAIILGNAETCVHPSGRVDWKPTERSGGLRVFLAAEMVVVLDYPSAVHCAPREVDGLRRRQACGRRMHAGADDRRLVVREIECCEGGAS